MMLLSRREPAFVVLLSLALCFGVVSSPASAAIGSVRQYQEVDIGVPPGFIDNWATAINDRSQVVGANYMPFEPTRAFIWQRDVMSDLDLDAYDINDQGEVVGGSLVGGSYVASLWQHGEVVDLGAGQGSVATGINNRTQIVGWRSTPAGEIRGFLWQHGVVIDLGLPGPAYPVAINDRGYVLVQTPEQNPRGLLWRGGVVARIAGTWVMDLNNHNEVVGGEVGAEGERTAFVWRQGNRMILPSLSGAANFDASAINDGGDIIGGSDTGQSTPYRPVLWHNGRAIDLTEHGVDTTAGFVDLNNRGEFAGTVDNGHHAVVYRPVTG